MKGRCLNLLTTGPNGSSSWTRTNDPAVNSRMLYQLSYRGIFKIRKRAEKICSFAKLFWQRLMFPGSHPPSIFSAEKLNFCVRYGYRCDLLAIATKCDYTFFKSVCNKTNQFYQTLNVNKSLSCDVFATTVTTLFLKVYLMKLTCLIMPSMSLNHSVVIYCGYTFI